MSLVVDVSVGGGAAPVSERHESGVRQFSEHFSIIRLAPKYTPPVKSTCLRKSPYSYGSDR